MDDRALLCPEDWEHLNAAVDAVIDDDRSKREIVVDLADGYRDAAAEGDEQAGRIHHAAARLGMAKILHQRARRQTGIFVDSATGQTLNVPERASVALRNESGMREPATQLRLWHELTWHEFNDWARQQLHFVDSLQFKVRGIRKVQALQGKFPESKTPGEALTLAGIDPASLDIAL